MFPSSQRVETPQLVTTAEEQPSFTRATVHDPYALLTGRENGQIFGKQTGQRVGKHVSSSKISRFVNVAIELDKISGLRWAYHSTGAEYQYYSDNLTPPKANENCRGRMPAFASHAVLAAWLITVPYRAMEKCRKFEKEQRTESPPTFI